MSESTDNSVNITDYLYSKASFGKIPLSGTFELSPLCNFSCRMCYVHKTAKEVSEHSRPMMKMKQWLEIAEEAKKKGMLYLLLTGGEPLLWPDFWTLYEKLSEMGFLIDINANGSLIDSAVVERLVNYPPRRVNITLYGGCDETYEALCGVKGTFAKVTKAVDMLIENNIQVKINISLTPYNVCDLEKIIRFAKDRDLLIQTTTYMFPPIRRDETMVGINERFTPEESARYRLECYRLQYGEEKYVKYLKDIQKGYAPPVGLDESCVDPLDGRVRCRAGKACFWVTWDGWMTPCGMMVDPKVDLLKVDFASAWENLTELSSNMILSGLCTNCVNQKICHACAAMAMAETGSSEKVPVYLCKEMKAKKEIADRQLKERGI